jgi:hypothetical protein
LCAHLEIVEGTLTVTEAVGQVVYVHVLSRQLHVDPSGKSLQGKK